MLRKCRKKDMEWEEISKLMHGRSAQMCRSRYMRMDYQKRMWREEEDEQLRELVSQHGEDWKRIASHFKRTYLTI